MVNMNKHLDLVNRLYEVICGKLSCIQVWGVYLFDSDFDDEPELRNKIGVIWICSLFDTIDAENRFIPEIIREAELEGWDKLVHNARQVQNLCKMTSELLSIFTMEEQIFMFSVRNQWVHGYLSNRHRDLISVKYLQDGKIKSEKMPRSEFIKITNSFFIKGGLDTTLKPLVEKAIDKKHRYWLAISYLQKYRNDIYSALQKDELITILV